MKTSNYRLIYKTTEKHNNGDVVNTWHSKDLKVRQIVIIAENGVVMVPEGAFQISLEMADKVTT